jgi:hypothetical protein
MKKFDVLLKKLETIDPKAVKYLEMMKNDPEWCIECSFNEEKTLVESFLWSETKQGHVYWSNLSKLLGE